MASVIKEIIIDAPPDQVWDSLRDFHAVHERLARGFVTASEAEDEATRRVTFFNGAVARERLIGVDEDARRIAYSVVEGPLGTAHHNASAQVLPNGVGSSRFVWITDLLPDDLAGAIDDLMTAGGEVIKTTLESDGRRSTAR